MVEFQNAWDLISKDWKETLKFTLFSFLLMLIPLIGPFLFMGLMIRTISTLLEKNELPEVFQDFKKMLINGLKYLLSMFIIWLIILLISLFSLLPLIISTGIPTSQLDLLPLLASPLLILPFILLPGLSLLYLIILPTTIINYAREEKVKELFNFKKALKTISNNFGGYLKMLIIVFINLILVDIIMGLVSFTILPALLMPGLNMLITSKFWTQWYKEV